MFNWLYNAIDTTPRGVQITLFVLFLGAGMVALIKGADWFVSGASDLAKRLGIPTIIVGLTVVSMGTSLPEASVSISSAIGGNAGISVGNVVGSNIFNLLVVLGFSAVFTPALFDKQVLRRDLPVMVGSALLMVLFAFTYNTQTEGLRRVEAIILLVFFVGYLVWTCLAARSQAMANPVPIEERKQVRVGRALLLLVVGLVLIVAGGDFVTYGAKNIALEMGVSEAMVGLTVVAIGTSLPELVTSIVAARKHENDIAVGNVIGSNIFNVLFILGMSATIAPVAIDTFVRIDIVIMAALFLVFCIPAYLRKRVDRSVGIGMIVLYVGYMAYVVAREFV